MYITDIFPPWTGVYRYDYGQNMKMPAHNLTLQCYGHESRISDCRNDHKYQPTCQQNLNVECMPGTSELATFNAFTNSLQTEQWVNTKSLISITLANNTLENVQFFQRIFCEFVPTANCTDGQVRLVDGATDVEGRVEICFSRRWGTIGGDGWTQTESTVVCNDLGYEATGKTIKKLLITVLAEFHYYVLQGEILM